MAKNTREIGFEKQQWDAACVLGGNLDSSECKSVVPGYRSGYYGRSLVTRVGKIELRVPRDRAWKGKADEIGSMRSTLQSRRRRSQSRQSCPYRNRQNLQSKQRFH